MPRHPPCALHSLSQQRHNNTRRNTPKQTKEHPTHPQSKDEPADSSDHHRQEKQAAAENNYTLTTRAYTPIVKMLASTMQISNNNPINPRHPQTRQEHERREDNQKNPPPPHQAPHQQDTVPHG